MASKLKPEQIEAVNFGVSIKINDETRGRQITGVYPSPSLPDLEAIVDRVVEFLNEQLGTKLGAIRVYTLDELEEVAPGEYQPKENANGKQTTEVAVEAN
jgi:hypothetical protein